MDVVSVDLSLGLFDQAVELGVTPLDRVVGGVNLVHVGFLRVLDGLCHFVNQSVQFFSQLSA